MTSSSICTPGPRRDWIRERTQQEPLVVGRRQSAVVVVEDVTGRDEVGHSEPAGGVRLVEDEPLGDASTAVVRDDVEFVESRAMHQHGLNVIDGEFVQRDATQRRDAALLHSGA